MTLAEPRQRASGLREPKGGTLPPGLWEYAQVLGSAVEARLGAVVGDVAEWVDAPRRLGQPHSAATPHVWGDGALCVDLGPDDGDAWQHFCAAMDADALAHAAPQVDAQSVDAQSVDAQSVDAQPVDAQSVDAETAAAQAQQWRLAVTPYRKPHAAAASCAASQPVAPVEHVSLAGITVVDLSTMWAGPLCTQLLARAGARVIKVEPSVRPDGLRGSPAHFRQLNDNKELIELDLRQPDERRALDGYLADADLLVTSMSRRALGNLGLLPGQLRQPMRTLAITAYAPDAPEADWIAYGSGVHATSGLGWLGAAPEPCAFSYPDPLAGLVAAATAADQLSRSRPTSRTVSLAAAVEPLARAAATAGHR